MTREEAINILSRPRTMKNTPNNILEAHNMAIKALEQELCTDAISRQVVLNEIPVLWNSNGDILHGIFTRFCCRITPCQSTAKDRALDNHR